MVNKTCPKCGGHRVQMSNERSKHGCLFFLLFSLYYIGWIFVKWGIAAFIFICYDWWMAIIKAIQKKGYIWQSKKWISGVKRTYYCHDCGYNFKA
ncbi:MAG: hypothetical protein LKF42_00570 [Streptococcaceae bacterium]|jgi:Zn finger protein HypA/HybF involved in hydrogenase expression|nr:hypothetical protein [Streptococcaceae bacterium]MCH4176226.1 hypothetical protein [Streptococcaceae bacterium]